ncbi:MAG: PQQ-binding-like beta-propeller repeat protein [Chloroflexi bacterium]|nr:PQQ-binding-like beta-propeller repeat protein [Chloroflexota bacterium]
MIEQQVDEVRVCRVCGHLNPSDGITRCNGCWGLLSGANLVPRADAERRSRFPRIGVWRKRHIILPAVLILAVIIWKAISLLELTPLVFAPDGATSQINAAAGSQDWAQPRNDARSSGFTSLQAPAPQKVKWTFSTAKPLLSSPAVVDGRVYFTTEDKRTIALDADTGAVVWEYPLGSPSSSTPVVTDDLVIFAIRPGLVVALDRPTGTLRWERDMGDPVLASPILANGTVYIGAADSALHALDAATGRLRWSYATNAWVIAPASYADGIVAVASQSSIVNIVGDRTGRRQLIFDAGRSRRIAGGPVIQGDRVYFGTRDGTVWAIDREARTWPFERAILLIKLNLHIWGLVGAPIQKGSVWSTFVGGDISRAVAVTPDSVYAGTREGRVAALDVATGEERWVTETGFQITSSPTVAGTTVMVGTKDGKVLGLDTATGKVIWDFQTQGQITAAPVVAGDTLYVASRDGTLYALTAP